MSPDNARTYRRTRLLSALLTGLLIGIPVLIAGGVGFLILRLFG